MTIKELIQHLSTFPPDMKVGRSGHYGEFHSMDKFDFDTTKIYTTEFGGDGGTVNETFLTIYPPDIGPEPD